MPTIIVLVIALIFGIATHLPTNHQVIKPEVKGQSTVVTHPNTSPTEALVPTSTPAPTIYVYPTVIPTTDSGLSNNNYYINSSGNEVHSPAYSNTVPAGATAQCRDGTYSFSQHRSGTCS